MNSAQLMPIIDLPVALHNREVEVIVLPQLEEPKDRKPHSERKSMMGCLSEYANPALRELEKGAWEQAAVEKYLEKMKDGRS
ncbi:MAG: hypothetical protein FWC43_06880 [Planctomycetaceae bacterium]|nr:hypothetical protein [Planctomycetaceae bacterium]